MNQIHMPDRCSEENHLGCNLAPHIDVGEDSKSQNSMGSGSNQSFQSTNSRAHMYKVSQINFVKKQ